MIQIVCRLLHNGKNSEEIIEILGEDQELIMAICNAAKRFSPEYDLHRIFELVYADYNAGLEK